MTAKRAYKQFHIGFSKEEWEIVCRKAKAARLRNGTYVRRMAVKGEIKYYELKELVTLKRAFLSIGNNLNQIATWLFVVDLVLIVIAGIIGGVFLSKKSSTDRVLTKEWDDKNVEDEEIATSGIIDAVGYDMKKVERFNVEDIVVEPDTSTSTTTNGTVAKSGKLKIKMNNNVSSVSIPTSEQAKIERKSTSATKSSEHSNGFFSAGDDAFG